MTNADGTDALEAQLMAFARGDARAARAIIAALAPRLLAFSTRMLGDAAEAEDVVQETLLRLWRAAPDWRPDGAKVSTWAFRVASNLAIDRLRRRARAPIAVGDETEHVIDAAPSAVERMTEHERRAALDAAVQKLPERQRQAVILRHVEGLTNPEIAAIMDIGIEAVESLTARGRQELKARLLPMKEGLSHDRT